MQERGRQLDRDIKAGVRSGVRGALCRDIFPYPADVDGEHVTL